MVAYSQAFDERPSLRNPFVASVGFHVSLFAVVIGASLWGHKVNPFGQTDSGPGVASIETVSTLPFEVRSTRRNPVANPTESQVPQQPKPVVKRTELEDPRAVAILNPRKQDKKKKREAAVAHRFQPKEVDPKRPLYSDTGPRVSTPIYAQAGGGGASIGTSPFGSRLGWYADLIRQRIGEKWRSQDVDPRLTNEEIVITFDIQRSGQVTNIRFVKRGDYSMGNSAMRAIQEASPLPQLPAEFERSSANVEFHFKLQR